MNYSVCGTTLTVRTDHQAGTVRVTRTNSDTTIAALTLTEAHEAAQLLPRALTLHASNPDPAGNEPHPFTLA